MLKSLNILQNVVYGHSISKMVNMLFTKSIFCSLVDELGLLEAAASILGMFKRR